MRFFVRQCFVCVLISLLVFPPAAFARSAVPDKSASPNKRPTMDVAPNGVPLVHIAKPSKSGLSHNQYTQFSVGQKGLILNNSAQTGVSQLGGAVLANPHLAPRGEAKVILNEVTSSSRSHIEGYIEVHGKRADVILANPNGVTVNGGGFINTDRATITTGKPQFDASGALTSFDVRTGDVRIDGAGMDAGNLTAFDIVSRAAAINAEIYADEIAITTGQNSYDPTTRKATPLSPDKSTAPKVAIDSSALGGMYAGRITLTSTEKGVGVNLQGVAQSLGDIAISSEGQLVIGAKTGKQTTLVTNGHLKAQGKSLEIANTATGAKGSTTLIADSIAVQKSTMYAGQNISLQAKDKLSLAASELNAEQTFTGKGAAIDLQNLELIAGKDLSFSGQSLTAKTSSLQSGGKSTATMTGDVSFDDFGLAAGSDITLKGADVLVNNADITGLGHINLTSNVATLYDSGLIASKGLLLSGKVLTGGRGSLLQSGEDMTLTASQALNFDTIQLQSGKKLSLASKGALDLRAARMSAQGAGSITGTAVTASDVKFVADKGLSLDGQSFQANDTSLHTAGALQVKTTGDVTLQNTELASNAELSLQGKSLLLENTALDATKSLTLQGTGVTLRNLSLATDGLLQLTAHTLFADDADLYAGNNALLAISNTVDLLNTEIFSRQDISLQGAVTALQKTKLGAEGLLKIKSTDVTLDDAQIIASKKDLSLDVKSFDATESKLHAGGSATLVSQEGVTLKNSEVLSGGNISVKGKALDFTGTTLGAEGNFSASGTGASLSGATIIANKLLALTVSSLTGTRVKIQSGADMTLDSQNGAITLAEGEILTGGKLSLASKALTLSDTEVAAQDTITVTATDTALDAVKFITNEILALTLTSLIANNAILSANNKITVTSTGNIGLTETEFSSGGILAMQGANVTLADSQLAATNDLTVTGKATRLDDSVLVTNEKLALTVRSLTGDGATLQSRKDATLESSGKVQVTDFHLTSGGLVKLLGNTITLAEASISALDSITITSKTLADFSDLSLITNAALDLVAQNITGKRTTLHAGGSAHIKATGNLAFTDTSEIASGAAITVDGNVVKLQDTSMTAGTDIAVTGTKSITLDSFSVTAGKLLSFVTEKLNVQSSLLQSKESASITSTGALAAVLDNVKAVASNDITLIAKGLNAKDVTLHAGKTALLHVSEGATSLQNVTAVAGKNLSLTTQALTAKKATLHAGEAASVTASTDTVVSFDDVKILAGKALSLLSYGLLAKNSAMQAGETATITMKGGKSLDLNNVTAVAGKDLRVTAQELKATDSLLHAGELASVVLAASISFINSQLAAGSDLTLKGKKLTLQDSKLSAQKAAHITGTAVQMDDTSLVAGKDVTLTAQSLVGKDVTLHAGGSLGIDLTGALQLDDSDVVVNNALTAQANSLRMLRSIVQAGKNITLTSDTQALFDATKAVSGNALTVTAQTIEGKGSKLYANSVATLSTPETIVLKNSEIVANTDVSIKAKDLQSTQTKLLAGNAMRFTLNTAFINTTGTILQTVGSLFISAPDITNAGGTIFAEGDLTLQSKRDIINEKNGLIFAGNNLSLLAKRYILNKENAVLMADGDLLIEGLAGARAAKLHNYAGLIESLNGDLTIRADVVENMATASTIAVREVLSDYFQHNLKADLNPYKGDGSPNYATWAHWNGKTGNKGIPYERRRITNEKYQIGLKADGEVDPNFDRPGDGRVFQEWILETEQYVKKQGQAGKLLAAHDIIIDADSVLNRESNIAAGNDISITTKNLDNIGTELSKVIDIYRNYLIVSESGDTKGSQRFDYHFLEVIDSVPAIINAGGRLLIVAENAVNNTGIKENADYIGTSAGNIIGGISTGNLPNTRPEQATAPSQTNTPQAPSAPGTAGLPTTPAAPGIATGPASVDVSVQATAPTTTNLDLTGLPPLSGSVQVGGTSPGQLVTPPAPSLPSGVGSLFNYTTKPGQKYLIESNPAFTQMKNLYGSDYFLSRIGLDPSKMHMQLMGDAFFESRYVRDQILAQTGKRFLIPGMDDAGVLRALMDNAADQGTSLGLTVGVSLSATQISQLTQDIVWLEEREVQGQKVLTPIVYLCDATRAELGNPRGAVLAGADVSIEAGSLTNSGAIRADNSLLINTTGNVLNLGGELSANLMVVDAGGSIINRSGSIIGGDVVLKAVDNIDFETQFDTRFISPGNKDTFVHQVANIQVDNLMASAGKDINSSAAGMHVTDAASLRAGRDVTIKSGIAESSVTAVGDRWKSRDHIGSTLTAGDLDIRSGRDITVAGSSVSASGDASLTADRNIAVVSQLDSSWRKTKSGTRKWENSATSNIASTISAGEDLSLKAGTDSQRGSITVIGSNLAAATGADKKGDLSLSATGDVVLAHATENTSSYYSRKKKGFLSSSFTQKQGTTSTSVGSNLSGENIKIHAGDNVLITGSKVAAANDLMVKADTGDVIVAAAQDTAWSKKETKKSKINLGDIGKFILSDFGAHSMAGISAFDNEVYVKSSEKFKNTTITNVGSILTAGNNLGIQAGRDISIMGSAVQADNDATLIAGRDVNLIPGREQYSSSLVKKRSSLGASGSLSESGVSGFMGTTTVEQGVTRTGDYTAGSYLGAGNDVLIKAGRDVNQIGSHIEAGRDVVVDAGQDWNMLASYDNETLSQYHKEVRTGVTGAIRQNVSSTVRTLIDLPQDAQAGEGGLGYSALTAASAGLRAVSAVTSSTSSPVSVSAKAGSSYSRTKYESSSSAARPSSVAAGRDVIASAGRDITIEGGQIAGGRDVVLDAGRDLTITSAKNSGDSRFSSINGGAGVGAKATVGSNGMAVGVNVQANAGGAGSKSDYTSHVNALIMAGETLSTSSGRDTTITGAHLEGENLWMDVGRDLTVASLQDHYDSKNYSWNVGVDVTIGYGVAVGVDLGVGFGKSKSDWTGQQTSLIGRSDVDIYTSKNTHLEGAIIATRPGGSLLLDTGTLTFEDVDDKNKGYQIGLGGSFSMNVGGEGFGNEKLADTPLGPIKAIDNGGPKAETPTGQRPYTPNSVEMQYSSHDMQAVLRPTITDGTIIIRDKPETSLAGLNRDIEKAREITKDEKVNVDVYIDPAAIDTVIGAVQKLERETRAQLAKLPAECVGMGEQGLDIMKNMIREGVSTEVAESILKNKEFQNILASSNNISERLKLAGTSPSEMDAALHSRQEQNDPLAARYTSGQQLLLLMGKAQSFVESIPHKEERDAALLAINAAMGGPVKTAVSFAANKLLDYVAGDLIDEMKQEFYTSVAFYLDTGQTRGDHLEYYKEIEPESSGKSQIEFLGNLASSVEFAAGILFGALGSIKKSGNKKPSENHATTSKPHDTSGLTIDNKQLDRKFKHAGDFGVTGNNNSIGRAKFKEAIDSHIKDPSTREFGTYRNEAGSKVYYNQNTNNVVVVSKNGDFVSGWKLTPGTSQYKHYLTNGFLQ